MPTSPAVIVKTDSDHRRQVPENSGAVACVGFSWERVLELLSNQIGEAAPEVRHKTTFWIVRARPNGVRIEFYQDDDAARRRLLDTVAELKDGPQIHAGRLSWM